MNIIDKKIINRFECFVESESQIGAYYKVIKEGNNWGCTCPHNSQKRVRCKHIDEASAEYEANL